jgi:hypothetical protein
MSLLRTLIQSHMHQAEQPAAEASLFGDSVPGADPGNRHTCAWGTPGTLPPLASDVAANA